MIKPIIHNSIYDTAALYNQNMDEGAQRKFYEFYKKLFAGFDVRTIHDCSVGAGGATIPLAKLGYVVSGSDLSANLLERARLNFNQFGYAPNLFVADFREIDKHICDKTDCVISTGNSLPHVDLAGFDAFLRSASALLCDGGLLYFDVRNWDAIVADKPVIHAIDPKVMSAGEHRSIYLLFNWHDDGSVTFSFATCVDKNGRHVSTDVVPCPAYYPLLKNDINTYLNMNGYEIINYTDMDGVWLAEGMENGGKIGDFDVDFPKIQWYGVLARKICGKASGDAGIKSQTTPGVNAGYAGPERRRELSEARRSIESTLAKCEKAVVKLREGSSQHTLLKRRIDAFKIALELIERELS